MVNFMVNFNGITSKVPFHEFFEFTVEEISQVFEYMGLMSTKETYPYTAGVLRRCSQLQDYKAFPGQAEPLCRPEPMADNRKCA